MSLNNNQDSVTFELEYKGKNGSQIKLYLVLTLWKRIKINAK